MARKRDVEGPIHVQILNQLKKEAGRGGMIEGAVIHHSPNEVDMRGKQAQIMVVRAKALGMRPGWPDLQVLWRGHLWTFEVKAPGNYATDKQKAVGAEIEAAGGKWAVVRSWDDARVKLEDWIDG